MNFRGICAYLIIILFLIGCQENKNNIKDKNENKPIKIGVLLPLNYQSYGIDPLNGIKLALSEMENKISSRNVELIVRDTEAQPAKGIDYIKELSSMGIQVIIGAAASNVSLALVPTANRDEIVLLSPISSATELTKEGGPYFFRTAPADPAQTKILVEWMSEFKPKKIGILFVDNTWGRGLADAAEKELREIKCTVIRQKIANDNIVDFSNEITAFKNQKIDILFSPLYPKSAGLAVKQCFELGLNVPVFGADSWGSQEFLDGAGKYAEGAKFCVPGISSGNIYEKFVSEYKATYNSSPNFNAASAYDCMHLLAIATEKLLNDNKEFKGKYLKDYLLSTTFNGATGISKFDKNGDVVGKEFTKKIIRNGKFDFLIHE